MKKNRLKIFVGIALFLLVWTGASSELMANPCTGPCESGTEPNCVYDCDPNACQECVDNVCESSCDPNDCLVCDGDGACESTCDPNDCESCDGFGDCPVTCDPNTQECCGDTCIDICDPNCNEVCDPNTSTCEGDCLANEFCCNGECCHNLNGWCCDDTECCDWSIGEICCGSTCCYGECCDDSDCEKCVSEICEPCLEGASDYNELTSCTGSIVDDPDSSPTPDGCSSPFGNNPASAACGPSSSFLGACNAHDTCYGTCNSTKICCPGCDDTFSSALATVCSGFSGGCRDSCDDWADYYPGAVLIVGQAAWEDAQVDECSCCGCSD